MKRWEVELRECMSHRKTEKVDRLSQAQEMAQHWVVGHPENTATIVNRRTGKLRMRYWFDTRLQYMEY